MVWEAEDWCFSEAGLEMVERGVRVRGPVVVDIFFGQVEQGSGDVGVA